MLVSDLQKQCSEKLVKADLCLKRSNIYLIQNICMVFYLTANSRYAFDTLTFQLMAWRQLRAVGQY